ncbi:hypothetical protein PAAG_02048 [Paracoccidioides lutzii Pb01]|uniref:Zinc-regulated transporter 2 n=1 Tax=Paracoccidioides lutzii (strain ATCC MYA-826 / Pb01) TaxID=502779 RepID=C1GU53_PARBA|nr:hypothetical protein PAAG_02048 [Paracoccidioides lutzii Pb01]EEH39859.1 hypothetical protein PAAG_02048 [Paracoccidioides lutzii Pb01]
MERPQCGSGEAAEDYDLPIHIVALFLVLAVSTFSCGFPVAAKKIPSMKIPPKAFFFCKHFGTGVLIATACVHLLPTAFLSLNDPCLPPLFTEQYPAMPGVIMLAALLSLFCIELWMNTKIGGHSHGGATGQDILHGGHGHGRHRGGGGGGGSISSSSSHSDRGEISWPKENRYRNKSTDDDWDDDKTLYKSREFTSPTAFDRAYTDAQSEMPPWFIAFYEQYIREREWTHSMLQDQIMQKSNLKEVEKAPDSPDREPGVDTAIYKKMSLNITILEGGILFHSVFVGITVSIESEGFIILLIAILFHQAFEGLGLGSRIAQVPYPKKSLRPWILAIAFGTTAPIGQAIGLVARTSYDPASAFALIMVGVFNAISSGLLIYAATVDLLVEDFLTPEGLGMSKRQKLSGVLFIFMGAACMSVVGAFA